MFPRDTHPSATLISSEEPFAFDLHVLGVPPAFVLSQDQTLKLNRTIMVLKPLSLTTRKSPSRCKHQAQEFTDILKKVAKPSCVLNTLSSVPRY